MQLTGTNGTFVHFVPLALVIPRKYRFMYISSTINNSLQSLTRPPFVFDGGRLIGSKPHDAPAQTAKSNFEQGNTTFPKKLKKI